MKLRWTSKTSPKPRWYLPRTLGRLMWVVALSGLGLASLTHFNRWNAAPVAMSLTVLKVVPSTTRLVHVWPQPRLDSPEDHFIHPAPEGIDARFVITAPAGIDDGMIVAPDRLFWSRAVVPSQVDPPRAPDEPR
jgi:hypothetical protein